MGAKPAAAPGADGRSRASAAWRATTPAGPPRPARRRSPASRSPPRWPRRASARARGRSQHGAEQAIDGGAFRPVGINVAHGGEHGHQRGRGAQRLQQPQRDEQAAAAGRPGRGGIQQRAAQHHRPPADAVGQRTEDQLAQSQHQHVDAEGQLDHGGRGLGPRAWPAPRAGTSIASEASRSKAPSARARAAGDRQMSGRAGEEWVGMQSLHGKRTGGDLPG